MSKTKRPASPALELGRKMADLLSIVHGVVKNDTKASDASGEIDAARMRLAAARAQRSSARKMIGSADRTAQTARRNREEAEALRRRFLAEAAEAEGFLEDADARLAAARAQAACASRMIDAADSAARTAARNRREAQFMRRSSRGRMEEADAFLEEADRRWEVVAAGMRRAAARAQRSSADTMIGSAHSMARTARRNKEEAEWMHHRFQEEAAEAEGFSKEAGQRLAAAQAQVAFASRMIDAANEMAEMADQNRNEAQSMHQSSQAKVEEAEAFLKEAERRWEMIDVVEFVLESSVLARRTCGLMAMVPGDGYDCYSEEENSLSADPPSAGVSFRSFLFSREPGKERCGEEENSLSPHLPSAGVSFRSFQVDAPEKERKRRKGKKKNKGRKKEEEEAPAAEAAASTVVGDTAELGASSVGDVTHVEEVLVEGAGTSEVNGTYRRCKTDGGDRLPSWFYSSKYPIAYSKGGSWEGREVTFFIYREGIRGVWNIVCENDPAVCATFYYSQRRGRQPPGSGWMPCATKGKGVSPAPRLTW